MQRGGDCLIQGSPMLWIVGRIRVCVCVISFNFLSHPSSYRDKSHKPCCPLCGCQRPSLILPLCLLCHPLYLWNCLALLLWHGVPHPPLRKQGHLPHHPGPRDANGVTNSWNRFCPPPGGVLDCSLRNRAICRAKLWLSYSFIRGLQGRVVGSVPLLK